MDQILLPCYTVYIRHSALFLTNNGDDDGDGDAHDYSDDDDDIDAYTHIKRVYFPWAYFGP